MDKDALKEEKYFENGILKRYKAQCTKKIKKVKFYNKLWNRGVISLWNLLCFIFSIVIYRSVYHILPVLSIKYDIKLH